MMDGKVYSLGIWDVVQSKAQLGTGAVGTDGVTPEIWQSLPSILVLRIHQLFQKFVTLSSDVIASAGWNKLAEAFDWLRGWD